MNAVTALSPLSRRHTLSRLAALLAAGSAPWLSASAQEGDGRTYASRADAMQWADQLAAARGLDRAWTRAAVADARFLPRVPRLMLPSGGGSGVKSWRAYRGRFIDATRIREGVRFWRDNQPTLARAEREFGVPASIIVGIIGVETIYGRNVGSFRVLDALATLTFDFPSEHPRAIARQAYFQGELETFLRGTARLGIDPRTPVGSYAGAMGLPQFMPSSWARFAVDYDRSGRIDLWNSEADAIGSVANYFRAYGWQPRMAVRYPVSLRADADLSTLLGPDILPTFTAAQMQACGAQLFGSAAQHRGPLALIELENGRSGAPQYFAGTENFYVITRYNWSAYYATAVLELGEEVARAVGV